MTVWRREAVLGGAKAIQVNATIKMVETTVQLGGDITRKAKKCKSRR